jgi:hypothetical protein
MKLHLTLAAAAIAFAAFGAGAANASVVLEDNFDTDTAVLNWAGDLVFTSIPGPGNVQGQPSVDLVGGNNFGNLAYSGNSIDLDGSTGNGNSPSGEIQSVMSLAQGDYTVSFLLAGNLRGATPQTTVISIGGQSYSLTPGASDGYTPYSLSFTNVSGNLTFLDMPYSDQQGNLLDNIVVTTAVPEPASWALMIVGFGAVGFSMRGRRKSLVIA